MWASFARAQRSTLRRHFLSTTFARQYRPCSTAAHHGRKGRDATFTFTVSWVLGSLIAHHTGAVQQLGLYLHQVMNAEFQPDYEPLQDVNQIRLLIIEPGSGFDPIQCQLKHVDLSQKPEYEAISYVWGDPREIRAIFCGGKEVRIRKSLFGALLALRLPNRPRILWADALCINQSDMRERAQQVQIMGEIYAKAQQVLVWLGYPTRETEGAFEGLRALDKTLQRSSGYKSAQLSWLDIYIASATMIDLIRRTHGFEDFDWSGIWALLQHAWPRRAWTFQEFVKAQRVTMLLGNQQMPSAEFFGPFLYVAAFPKGMTFMRQLGLSVDQLHGVAAFLRIGMQVTEEKDHASSRLLRTIADNARVRDAADSRDLIFAFMGAASDSSDWNFLLDYTAQVEEVYCQLARRCLLYEEDLEYLSYAGSVNEGRGRYWSVFLPTWVADWRHKDSGVSSKSCLAKAENEYNASADSPPVLQWDPKHPRLLHIRGRMIDQVDRLGVTRGDLGKYVSYMLNAGSNSWPFFCWPFTPAHPQELSTDRFRHAQHVLYSFESKQCPPFVLADAAWMDSCKHIASGGAASMSSTRLEEFWRSMICDRVPLQRSCRPRKEEGETFQRFMELLEEAKYGHLNKFFTLFEPTFDRSFGGKAENSQWDFQMAIETEKFLETIVDRRFCSTTSGRIGWAPPQAQAGDLVCLFHGARVPYIIRPKSRPGSVPVLSLDYWRNAWGTGLFGARPVETEPEYILIGECYIQGIMDGEAMADSRYHDECFTLM